MVVVTRKEDRSITNMNSALKFNKCIKSKADHVIARCGSVRLLENVKIPDAHSVPSMKVTASGDSVREEEFATTECMEARRLGGKSPTLRWTLASGRCTQLAG